MYVNVIAICRKVFEELSRHWIWFPLQNYMVEWKDVSRGYNKEMPSKIRISGNQNILKLKKFYQLKMTFKS